MKKIKTSKCLVLWVLPLAFCCTSNTVNAGIFGPSNYWECVLENISGTQSDNAARAIIRNCNEKFSGDESIEKKSNWFGPSNRDECIIEYGKNVSGKFSSRLLIAACNRLYD